VSQGRILAVDDQLYFRVYLEDLLREAGFDPVTCSTGAEALAALESGGFEVVLTDLVMPGVDGGQLVQRIKDLRPDQDVVVITSVGDVKTAVDAMKLGATDYLLKPLDRVALLRSLSSIRERRRMREENRRLTTENLDHLSVFAQYERILALFAAQSLEQLADRVVEMLCLETNAHGGVAWIGRPDAPSRLRLVGVSGLVRVEGERNELHAERLPRELAALALPGARPLCGAPGSGGNERACLYVPLARAGKLLGFVRLTDKLDGSEFGEADIALTERLGAFASQALANAFAVRALERRSFRDPITRAYTKAYLDDIAEHETQKSRRFSRSFSLVRIEIDQFDSAWEGRSPAEVEAIQQAAVGALSRGLRAADILAIESDGRYFALLPETDGIGAAVSKRRLRAALERCDELRAMPAAPTVLAAAATFPTDGASVDALSETLAARIADDRASFLRAHELEHAPFRGLVDALLAEAPTANGAFADQVASFLIGEVARRPEERGLLFVGPGGALRPSLRQALERLRGVAPKTEVVCVADRSEDAPQGLPVTWVSPLRAGTEAPFLLYFGERPAYALVREPGSDAGEASLYHTADRVLVEHLTFQLGRDLGIPIGG
jgi:FixJ family two-component response regulator/GGDEF domain-containing protein